MAKPGGDQLSDQWGRASTSDLLHGLLPVVHVELRTGGPEVGGRELSLVEGLWRGRGAREERER